MGKSTSEGGVLTLKKGTFTPDPSVDGQMSRLVEQAYHAIRASIISGEFPGGTPLSEDDLADRIGSSRTPIREALKRLHGEGLVVLQRNRRARVAEMTKRSVQEIFEIRSLLEPRAAARAAEHIGEADLERLAENLRRMRDLAVDWSPLRISEFVELNTEFHMIIVEASGNKRMRNILQPLIDLAHLVHDPASVANPTIVEQAGIHHEQILAAIRRGDPSWAESQMTAHIIAAHDAHQPPVDSFSRRWSPRS